MSYCIFLHNQMAAIQNKNKIKFMVLRQAFFSTAPKKLKDEKTQNSKKKLKTQAKNSRIRQILV